MITFKSAKAIAEAQIRRIAQESNLLLVLNPHVIEEFEAGWVFFYNTKPYFEGDRSSTSLLAGNGPLLVLRQTGELKILPASMNVGKGVQWALDG
ncbi:MAG: YrhB domain-containing protein [Verrucomicrobiota bacterium JB022]|nr:YrhB domain-containing protein [Verrucomicrobiota bacterium JB022]